MSGGTVVVEDIAMLETSGLLEDVVLLEIV